jgi:hypothetical protein
VHQRHYLAVFRGRRTHLRCRECASRSRARRRLRRWRSPEPRLRRGAGPRHARFAILLRRGGFLVGFIRGSRWRGARRGGFHGGLRCLRVSARRQVETRTAVFRHGGFRELRRLDVQDEVADVDLVRGTNDLRAGDLLAVHVGSVGALQVEDNDLPVLDDELGVLLGDIPLRQADVVLVDAADGDLFRVEVEAPGRAAPLREDHAETHAAVPPRAAV